MSRIYVLAELKDTNTTVDELKLKVKMFCDERDWGKYHNLKELTIGLVTESAELLQLFRFKSETDMSKMLQTPNLWRKFTMRWLTSSTSSYGFHNSTTIINTWT